MKRELIVKENGKKIEKVGKTYVVSTDTKVYGITPVLAVALTWLEEI